MAASTTTVSLGVSYTPPGASLNSGNSTFQLQATYNGQSVGQIDVPSTFTPGTQIDVPFGNIAATKVVIIKNMMSVEVGVRLNGAVTNTFNLAPGGECAYATPSAPSSVPLTSAGVVPVAAPSTTESCYYFVFGD